MHPKEFEQKRKVKHKTNVKFVFLIFAKCVNNAKKTGRTKLRGGETAMRYGSRALVLSGREMDRCCGEPRRDLDPHMDKLLTPAKRRRRTPPSLFDAAPTDKHY
ncbi:unnamed protein product [Leptosia nina]|uniref:Uncharacterized protein n=1 Tax=Leptosia nina TaxID=320188 RepID=A0AAV1JYP9_9NEOP